MRAVLQEIGRDELDLDELGKRYGLPPGSVIIVPDYDMKQKTRSKTMTTLKALFTSKKWLTALLGVVAGILEAIFEIPTETIIATVSPFIAYICGQAAVDVKKQASWE
jgi:hypothetical protein